MIPNTMQEDNDSYGEKQVFEALKTKLGPEYVVFHSVRWNDIYSAKMTELDQLPGGRRIQV